MRITLIAAFLLMAHPHNLYSQDSSFVPYVQFDSLSGNFHIFYYDEETDSNYVAIYEPTTKINPFITCIVSSHDTMVDYSYTIRNGLESKQKLLSFDIPPGQDTANLVIFCSWPYLATRDGNYLWFLHPRDILGLSPGDSLSCLFEASELPGIVSTSFAGRENDTSLSFWGEPDEKTQVLIDSLTNLEEYQSVYRQTIGPHQALRAYQRMDGLDTIRYFVEQSSRLGWIDTPAHAAPYLTLVDTAKARLGASHYSDCAASLDTLLTWCRRDTGTALSSEAYGLLYYNGRYLLEHLPVHTVTASNGAAGMIEPSGSVRIDSGQSQTFRILPAANFGIDSLIVDGVAQSPETSYTFVNVTANHTIRVVFRQVIFTITASVTGTGGTISPSGAVNINAGSSQSFTLTPQTGYHVATLLVDGISQEPGLTYQFTNIMAAHSISATFAINTYSITASSGPNGAIGPSGVVTVQYGDSARFTFTPASCHALDSVIIDGVKLASSPLSYTFYSVSAPHTVRAGFVILRDTLSVTAGSHGTVTKKPNQTYFNCGERDTLIPVPVLGYKVSAWSGDTSGCTRLHDTLIVTMNANRSISCSFTVDHYLLVPTKYPTIQAAVDSFRLGDTIAVAPGTYGEAPYISRDSTLLIAFSSAGHAVNVQGFAVDGCAGITIRGFHIDATGLDGGIAPGIALGSDGIVRGAIVENNEITGGYSGIIAALAFNCRIANNVIHDNFHDGVNLPLTWEMGDSFYVINNTIANNKNNGISSGSDVTVYIVNNIISFNGNSTDTTGGRYGVLRKWPSAAGGGGIGDGMQLLRMGGEDSTGSSQSIGNQPPGPHPERIKLLNNFIVGNQGPAYTGNSSGDIGNYGQTLDSGDSGNLTTAGTEGTGVSQSPSPATFSGTFKSASPLDLHLKSGAVPINRGLSTWSAPIPLLGAIPATDFEGTTRPQGTAVDMGADEY